MKIGQAQGESGRRPSACSSVRPSETAEQRKPRRLFAWAKERSLGVRVLSVTWGLNQFVIVEPKLP